MGTLKLIQISFSSNGDLKAFASQMCLSHYWNSVNGNPPSNICLELICCVTNSGEILKAKLECFVARIFTDFTVFHELQLPLCCFNLFEIWKGHS